MANTVIALKKSGTPSSVPSNLANGELAINYADGKLYYKAANGTIASISGNEPNFFGSVSANGTLIVSDIPSDILTLDPGNNISIVGDSINDKVIIGLKDDVVIPSTGTFKVAAVGGDEGGEIKLANAINNSVLTGDIIIDIYQNKLRFFESIGTNRGAFINLASAAAGVGTDLLAGATGTDTTAREWATGAFDKANNAYAQANAAYNAANNAVTDFSPAFIQANTARDHANAAFTTANSGQAAASAAFARANTANITADRAWNHANAAFITANIAFANANTVMISAQAAFTVANSGFLHANASYAFANSVSITANAAFIHANAAFANANTVMVSAQEAFTVANSSFLHANSGYAFANSIAITANLAFAHANAAFANGNVVIQTAQSAFTQANAAIASASAGQATANAAFARANLAHAHANASYAFGNSAHSIANLAFTHANAAFASSNSVNSYSDSTYVKLTSPSQTITGNLAIVGGFSVSGNTTIVNAENLRVADPLIYLAGNNYVSDIVDIGFIANYVNATGQNVHTGLYREHENKEYYLFQGYDREPANNHIGALSNNMTLAVLNADLKTSNLTLGGANAILTIGASFNHANAAHATANAAFARANIANITADRAWNHANAAFANANTVMVSAQAAFTVANSSFLHANAGYAFANSIAITANLAFVHANAAFSAANVAGNEAEAAFLRANLAHAHANAAFAVANTARTETAASFLTANIGYAHANASFARANAALPNTSGAAFAGNLNLPTGNLAVGIASANVGAKLQVYNTTGNSELWITADNGFDPTLRLTGEAGDIVNEGFTLRYDNSVGDVYFENKFNGTAAYHFQTAVVEAFTIQTDGKVGVGTTSPGHILDVKGAANVSSALLVNDMNVKPTITAAFAHANLAHAHANAAFARANTANITADRAWNHANAAFATVNSAFGVANTALPNTSGVSFAGNLNFPTGNVGIGAANTSDARLAVDGNVRISSVGVARLIIDADTDNVTESDHAQLYIRQDGASTVTRLGYFNFSNDFEIIHENAQELSLGTNNTKRLRIDSGGNVAIGGSATSYKLEVFGSFAAQTKSFVINHPTKPEMKLRYGSLEGPENGVYVRGKLEGKSIIELPEYWWNLIDESTITVNLTPIGRSQDIWVQSTSAYFIHLNQPADCFFTVFAERKDVDKLVVEY